MQSSLICATKIHLIKKSEKEVVEKYNYYHYIIYIIIPPYIIKFHSHQFHG